MIKKKRALKKADPKARLVTELDQFSGGRKELLLLFSW